MLRCVYTAVTMSHFLVMIFTIVKIAITKIKVYKRFIFLNFAVANWSITLSKFIFSNVSRSMLRRARLLRRACPIDARKYDKINFNLLKDRSQLAMDTAIVNKICSEMRRVGFIGAHLIGSQ